MCHLVCRIVGQTVAHSSILHSLLLCIVTYISPLLSDENGAVEGLSLSLSPRARAAASGRGLAAVA